jgi:hypothetical protein
MSMENYVGMISTDRNSRLVHQNSLAILPAETSCGKAGGTGEESYEFGFTKYLCSYFEGIFIWP